MRAISDCYHKYEVKMTIIHYAETNLMQARSVFESQYASLPDFRKNKADRLKIKSSKNLCIASWLALRSASVYFGINADTAGFDYDTNGKPFFRDYPNTFISISHSGSIATCAISDKPTGIDIEQINTPKEGICERFFSNSECNYIASASDYTEKTNRFFRVWVLKESYVKYTGVGIGDFRNFGFSFRKNLPEIKCPNKICTCRFFEPEIPEYKISVCTEDSDIKEFRKINII